METISGRSPKDRADGLKMLGAIMGVYDKHMPAAVDAYGIPAFVDHKTSIPRPEVRMDFGLLEKRLYEDAKWGGEEEAPPGALAAAAKAWEAKRG